jgi:hypothetical protein
MTQADRVFNTPPTNTPVTRRKILGTAAGAAAALAATGASPMAASPAPDPIFAAIDAYRQVDAEFMAHEGPEDIPDELGDRQWDAYEAVLRTRPTTPAGLVALTSFARERSEWLIANSSVRSDEDERAVFAAIDNAAKALSEKAVA